MKKRNTYCSEARAHYAFEKEDFIHIANRKYLHIYKVFRKKVRSQLEKDGCVLDLGCGSDSVLEDFDRAIEKIGLDIDKTKLKILFDKTNLGGSKSISLILASAERLPFSKQMFDLVVMRDVVEHLNDVDATMHELAYCLKDCGKIIFTTSNLLSPVMFFDTVLPHKVTRRIIDQYGSSHVYAYERNRRITPFFRLKDDVMFLRELVMFSQPPFIQGDVYKKAYTSGKMPKIYYVWMVFTQICDLLHLGIFKEMILAIAQKQLTPKK